MLEALSTTKALLSSGMDILYYAAPTTKYMIVTQALFAGYLCWKSKSEMAREFQASRQECEKIITKFPKIFSETIPSTGISLKTAISAFLAFEKTFWVDAVVKEAPQQICDKANKAYVLGLEGYNWVMQRAREISQQWEEDRRNRFLPKDAIFGMGGLALYSLPDHNCRISPELWDSIRFGELAELRRNEDFRKAVWKRNGNPESVRIVVRPGHERFQIHDMDLPEGVLTLPCQSEELKSIYRRLYNKVGLLQGVDDTVTKISDRDTASNVSTVLQNSLAEEYEELHEDPDFQQAIKERGGDPQKVAFGFSPTFEEFLIFGEPFHQFYLPCSSTNLHNIYTKIFNKITEFEGFPVIVDESLRSPLIILVRRKKKIPVRSVEISYNLQVSLSSHESIFS